jgi:hypothetical protein
VGRHVVRFDDLQLVVEFLLDIVDKTCVAQKGAVLGALDVDLVEGPR